jgi:hypothetical protein
VAAAVVAGEILAAALPAVPLGAAVAAVAGVARCRRPNPVVFWAADMELGCIELAGIIFAGMELGCIELIPEKTILNIG